MKLIHTTDAGIKIYHLDITFYDRDFVVLRYPTGLEKSFYRSTGRNSGTPDIWYPFDGISPYDWTQKVWFNKTQYCSTPDNDIPDHLNRYGSTHLKFMSEVLGSLNIEKPTTSITDHIELNRLLGTTLSLSFNDTYYTMDHK